MQKTVKNRLLIALLVVTSIACGVILMLRAMSDNIVFFYAPSELYKASPHKEMRVGGLVKVGSLHKIDAATITFYISDFKADLKVHYRGVIPMLFRENQGVVARGEMHGDLFIAKELLTKHDENYSPPVQE